MVQTSKEIESESVVSAAAKKVHPEDLCIGDDVAVSEQVYQYPSFCWEPAASIFDAKEQPVRIAYLPATRFEVYTITSLCLPFVMVKDRKDKTQVFDVRLTRLFRLSEPFANEFRSQKNRKSKSKKKRKKR